MKSRFLAVYTLFFASGFLLLSLNTGNSPAIKPLAQLPQNFNEWRMIDQKEFSQELIDVLRPSDYLSRKYSDGKGNVVQLYIGYHDGSDRSGPIHSPRHCLPGSGWSIVSEEKMQVHTGKAMLNIVKSLYQKGGEKELFLYWFQLRDKSVTNEYALKLVQLYNSVFHKRRDAAFVRISLPATPDGKSSSDLGIKFITGFYPFFSDMVPK